MNNIEHIPFLLTQGFKSWADEKPHGTGYYRLIDVSDRQPVRVVYLYDLGVDYPGEFEAGEFNWDWDPVLGDPEGLETSWSLTWLYWAPLAAGVRP